MTFKEWCEGVKAELDAMPPGPEREAHWQLLVDGVDAERHHQTNMATYFKRQYLAG